MSNIIPTVFATSKAKFNERFNKLIKVSKNLQIDFMDGKFVKSKSVPISQIPDLNKLSNNFEAHLMIYHPEKKIKKLKKKGFKKIIFHLESIKQNKILSLIEEIKKQGMICFLAINPETKIEKILPFIPKIDGVLFLGVHPGEEHQSFLPSVYKKIKNLREINRKIKIQVDGGINDKTIKELAHLSVNAVNSGSFISESDNPKQAFKNLNKLFVKYKKG